MDLDKVTDPMLDNYSEDDRGDALLHQVTKHRQSPTRPSQPKPTVFQLQYTTLASNSAALVDILFLRLSLRNRVLFQVTYNWGKDGRLTFKSSESSAETETYKNTQRSSWNILWPQYALLFCFLSSLCDRKCGQKLFHELFCVFVCVSVTTEDFLFEVRLSFYRLLICFGSIACQRYSLNKLS